MTRILRSFLALGAIIAAVLITPAAASAANCETAPVWAGSGTEPWAGSIQATINNASAGETVVVPNGTYSAFSLTRNVRVVAANRYGATVNGNVTFTAGWMEGFVFPNTRIDVSRAPAGNITFINNRIMNGPVPGQEFHGWLPNAKIIVWGNDFRDPHFSDGTAVDYAVQLYGSSSAEVCHNYFYGHWHQTISFKEGNNNYSIAYNTIEGCSSGTCIFLGQNNGDSGTGRGLDTGLIQVHHNRIQRAVTSSGSLLYHARDPIRIGYLRSADVRVYDNVIIGPLPPALLIWGSGNGTIRYTNNAVFARANGTTDGSVDCIRRTGTGYTITVDRLQCYDATVSTGGGMTITNTKDTAATCPNGPSAVGECNQSLVFGPNPRFDPDLSLLGGSPPPPPPDPPTAAFTWSPQNPHSPPTTVTFDGSGSTCPSAPCTYTYDHAGSAFPNDDTGTPAATFTYQATGTKTVRLTVRDANGATAQVTHSFEVAPTPPPPTAEFTWTPQNPSGPPVTVTFNGSASSCAATPCSYVYDHAGTPFPGDDPSTPTATFQYQATGTKTVRLTVKDNTGRTAQVTRSFSVSP